VRVFDVQLADRKKVSYLRRDVVRNFSILITIDFRTLYGFRSVDDPAAGKNTRNVSKLRWVERRPTFDEEVRVK
jgi:hypothetical protein